MIQYLYEKFLQLNHVEILKSGVRPKLGFQKELIEIT